MRIALVSPGWLMKNDYPPLGLAYLAAMLKTKNCEVKIFDFTLEPKKTLVRQAEEVLSFSPELIGITISTNTYSNAVKLAREIKNRSSGTVLVGGPHPTIFPKEMLSMGEVDFVVFGEGEYTFSQLIDEFFKEKDFYNINGIAFKNKTGEIVVNPPRPFINELDALPFPDRRMFNLAKYNLRSPNSKRMATLITSRGCPFNCIYCYKGLFGNQFRMRSVENIIEEIRYIINSLGIRAFYFIDDLFLFDKERLLKFCEKITEENLDIEWQCLARVDLVNPDMLSRMKGAGCSQIFYGIESGNINIMRNTKGITLKQAKNAVQWTKKAGICASGYFMLALPNDTQETMAETIAFASALKMDEAMFSITTPFPGTRLWENMEQTGIKAGQFNFDNAFYHGFTRGMFINLSKAADKDVLLAYKKARALASDIHIRSILIRKFGPKFGKVLYLISRVEIFRIIGRFIFRNVTYEYN